MKYPETARRIAFILNLRNMKPQQLANKSGVGKSSISHYINGSNEPHNHNAGKMAKVLRVNPQWLMGFDVPMDPDPVEHYDFYLTGVKDFVEMDPDTNDKAMMVQRLFTYMKKLNAAGIEKLIERSEELTDMQKYRKEGDENVMD